MDLTDVYVDTRIGEDTAPPEGRFTSGPSLDGKGEYSLIPAEPQGEKPVLGPPDPAAFAQNEQVEPESPATPAS
jgi:Mn-containing catalase